MPISAFAQALFAPRSVVLVGASRKEGTAGHAILANLIAANDSQQSPRFVIHAVNPNPIDMPGALWSPSISAIAGDCDLAVIAVPAAHVPETLRELGARGTRLAVIISAGLGEASGLKPEMLAAAAEANIRLIGPNCLGILVPRAGLNASFAPIDAMPGKLAFLSQSGALATGVLDWAHSRSLGFSAVLSIGDMADLALDELVDLFAADADTDAILIYLEGLSDARAFWRAARAAAAQKPVIVLKAGRSQAAARAAKSHTGSLAGSYDVYRAALRQAGLVLVESLEDLFDAAAVLGRLMLPAADRLAIVTNGGGAGILAVDALSGLPGRLATLTPATIATLNGLLPAGWSGANPVDIIGDARASRYCGAVEAVLADANVDALLVMNCPTALADGGEVARAVAGSVAASHSAKPVLACWLGDANAHAAAADFTDAGIALFQTPDEAIRAFSCLVQAAASKAAAGQPLPAPTQIAPASLAEAKALIAAVRADNRLILSEPEAKVLLALFGVPVVPTVCAATPTAVEASCAGLEAPYAVKIVSPDLTHKSDIGGVALGLADATAARCAAEAMLDKISAAHPEARLQGFSVQPMIRRKQAHELFAGIAHDPAFGPLLMVGAGGTAVEVLADRAIRLPPIGEADAAAMLAETRISRLLGGYRDVPATHAGAIVEVMLALSCLAITLPEVAELDINPLLADSAGVIALDARVVLAPEGMRP